MRRFVLVFLVALLILAPLAAQASGPDLDPSAVSLEASGEGDEVLSLEGQAMGALASSSPLFIENVGQFAPGARFQMRGGPGTVWLAEDAIWITLLEKDEVGRMNFSLLPESGEGPAPEWGNRGPG